MKYVFTLILCCSIIGLSVAQFRYISPAPGSAMHNREATIILKNGNYIDRESLNDNSVIEIYGSTSGKHQYSARLSDDNKTIVVKPTPIFNWGETVFVTVNGSLRKENGEKIDGTYFTFKIRDEITAELAQRYQEVRLLETPENGFPSYQNKEEDIEYPLDSMPTFTININNNPAPGQHFYTSHGGYLPSFPTIINNNGAIVWAMNAGDEDGADFKLNHNGYLTYCAPPAAQWMVMDSNYNIIDSFQCTNGYEASTNVHDFLMFPNGHVWLQAYDLQTIDMTAYGGVPNATVYGLILQELDANRDLVFEWRSWDHFQFTDANAYTELTNAIVDYCHGNSIEICIDGNVMISCRNMNELTKIDHETGDIIWRLGGENNQFTFVNDNIPEHFHSQHDARMLPNGNITLYNNGNQLPDMVSSAKEYAIDEVNKTATLVWYYEHPDVNGFNVYSGATGSVQRLPNGNTLIDWGIVNTLSDQGIPNFTEVDMNKNIVWEMKFDSNLQRSYRIHKYVWNPCSRITGYTMNAKVSPSQVVLSWGPATGAAKYEVHYRKLNTTAWTVKKTAKTKLAITGLPPMAAYEWRVRTICSKDGNKKSAFSVLDTFKVKQFKLGEGLTNNSIVVSIYPVPASDHITIELTDADNAQVTIINTLGDIAYESPVVSGELTSVNVDVRGWPAGIYVVQVENNDQLQSRKILVD